MCERTERGTGMTHEKVLDEVNVLYERLQGLEDCEGKYLGCGRCSFNDGNYIEALEVLIDYYEVGLIEELEKIKTEIQGLIDFEESCCGNTTLGYQCLGVIDDKISELKGEKDIEM